MRPLRCSTSRRPLLFLDRPICRQHVATVPRRLLSSSPLSYPQLLTVRDIPTPHIGCARIISFNSPHNRNAISRLLLSELRGQVDALRTEDGTRGGPRVLILASDLDEAFCAGADLKERKVMSETETKQFLNDLRSTFTAISNLRIPTITAVASVALGGGLELALATTLRVFSTVAQIGLPETRLGIIPGAGGTYRLRELIGESEAQQLILTGRMISGRTAYRLGLCNHVFNCEKGVKRAKSDNGADTATGVEDDGSATTVNEEDKKEEDRGGDSKVGGTKKLNIDFKDGVDRKEQMLKYAVRIGMEICEGGPVALSAAFEAVKDVSYGSEGIAYGFCLRQGDKDRREALAAFKEKRKPRFSGRQSAFTNKRLEDLETQKDGGENGDGVSLADILNRTFGQSFSRPLAERRPKYSMTPEEEEKYKELKTLKWRTKLVGMSPEEQANYKAMGMLKRQMRKLRLKEKQLVDEFQAILQTKEETA